MGGLGLPNKNGRTQLYYRLLQERFFFSKFHERLFKSGICLILYTLSILTRNFEDSTPAIQVQTLPLEGPRILKVYIYTYIYIYIYTFMNTIEM